MNQINNKLKCKSCESLILPATADLNDGQCFPCKRGENSINGKIIQKSKDVILIIICLITIYSIIGIFLGSGHIEILLILYGLVGIVTGRIWIDTSGFFNENFSGITARIIGFLFFIVGLLPYFD